MTAMSVRQIFTLLLAGVCWRAGAETAAPSLSLPAVGEHELRILSPTVLELFRVTTKKPDPARPDIWDFVDAKEKLQLPALSQFVVRVGKTETAVGAVGFRRRVDYAPLRQRDLRIGNSIFLQLQTPIPDGEVAEVLNPSHQLWPEKIRFTARNDPARLSPAIHVNQVGYTPQWPKRAMVGEFLGSLGEMQLQARNDTNAPRFTIIETPNGKAVFRGELKLRRDRGFPYECYQEVWEADFSALQTPGEYRLAVPGLGVSLPFLIDDGIPAAFARTLALGAYHQRCGLANEMPFTRFTHGPCHLAPAEVPDLSKKFEFVNHAIASESDGYTNNTRHTAPQLKDAATSLFPYVRKGRVDVSGGHHDAGDYSKYSINSAQFIHHLVFAADVFPGAAELDNLGLPESGDGKSDLLQEAKLEADFLARMQDDDGGFYFLVYPRDRPYELDVLPDHGDPQVVWPKTTAISAAATAALAQCASSPKFRAQFPEAAVMYLEKAKKGWAFLERALAKHGKDGAYQRISHYGDIFMHDDELAWAACEMFLATGDEAFQKKLIGWMNVGDISTRRWSWWRMFEAYGSAIRSYTFAAEAGKIKRAQQNPLYLDRCEAEVAALGEDQLRRAQDSAYGTSFPEEAKRYRTGGWYFPGDCAFDLAVAAQLDYPKFKDPRPKLLDAIISNLNYEAGCNPVNRCHLTGLGWNRQHEAVHQFALNDRRTIPQTGIPFGSIQAGFGWLEFYGRELGALSWPLDGDEKFPYAIYDRWGDSFNLSTEFVAVNQARELACLAWLMAQTPLKNQPWKPVAAQITGLPKNPTAGKTVNLALDLGPLPVQYARIVWEANAHEPSYGTNFTFSPTNAGPSWIEAEAQLPDGRRVFAVTNFTVAPAAK
ncbi:MAG: glycoside hydrolase family 9 [Pedosphaera sp.]|nr:glycoside hydrolase family 9 [Pedosphaera sp.]